MKKSGSGVRGAGGSAAFFLSRMYLRDLCTRPGFFWGPVAARRLPVRLDFRQYREVSTGRLGASIRSGLSLFGHVRFAKDRVRKSKGPTNLRHSRESGNLLRCFRKKNRADIADGRLQIPAFAGMTKYYSMGTVFYDADTSAIRPSR